jgi:hypothetical protein
MGGRKNMLKEVSIPELVGSLFREKHHIKGGTYAKNVSIPELVGSLFRVEVKSSRY